MTTKQRLNKLAGAVAAHLNASQPPARPGTTVVEVRTTEPGFLTLVLSCGHKRSIHASANTQVGQPCACGRVRCDGLPHKERSKSKPC